MQAGWQSPPRAQAAIAAAAGISCPLVGPSAESRRGFLVKQTPLGARRFQLTPRSFQGDHFAVVSAEVFQVQPSVSHSLAAWDTEETLFIGARALHVKKTLFFFPKFFFSIAPELVVLFPKQMHSVRWVGTLTVPGAAGSGMVWEKGSQGGCTGLGWGWHHSPKAVGPLWQHRHQCLGCMWSPTAGHSHKTLVESFLWDFGGTGTSGFASPSLERGAAVSHLSHLVSHFTLSQTILFFGTNPAPIWGDTVLPCTAQPSHPPPAFRGSLQAQSREPRAG